MEKTTDYERRWDEGRQYAVVCTTLSSLVWSHSKYLAAYRHWTVTVSEPLAQLLPTAYEAVMVTVPEVTNEAVFEENETIEVSLEDHVVDAVTSVPLSAAKNCAVVPLVNAVPEGEEVIVRAWLPVPPVTLPVADPLTPPTDAVMVTFDTVPTPLTVPALTVAHALELCQDADLVTSLEPLLKLAIACSWTVDP